MNKANQLKPHFNINNIVRHNIKNTFLTVLSLCFLFFLPPSFAATEQKSTALAEYCSVNDPVPSKDGIRRLAMIVGVGEYKDPRINDLPGPPNDAQNMYDLLTGKGGYAFPKENVCLLVNAEATTKKFTQSFTSTLINRAQPGDEVVFFYAGHGSQVPDKLDDDETISNRGPFVASFIAFFIASVKDFFFSLYLSTSLSLISLTTPFLR